MRIRSKLIAFSAALLLFPTVLIVILARILYYRLQWDGAAGNEVLSMWSLMFRNYGLWLCVALLIGILLLMVIGVIFLRSVLGPLNQLRRAAEQIEAGNLDVEIFYSGQDEFRPVFEQFDIMRAHIKDLLWKRVQDEKDRVDMIANIAHDFKTPVTAIQGYAQGLLDGVANTKEKEERYLRTIVSKSWELSGMAQNLYDLSSLQVKAMKLAVQDIPLKRMLDEMQADIMIQYEGLVVLESDFSATEGRLIAIDPLAFRRVVANVVQNSIKYRQGDTVHIQMQAECAEGRAILCITDDGKGVPAEDCERIFERFFRSDQARSSVVGGSGLGLSIAKEMMEGMGGRIWARPGRPGGLSVYISFPLLGEMGEKME